MIEKIAIRNFRTFKSLDLTFTPGLNVIVGPNDAGKSTLLEAIQIALSGRLSGRAVNSDLSPYLINLEATNDFLVRLATNRDEAPPSLTIDVFLSDTAATAILRGTNNVFGEDACGIRFQAQLSADFLEEYRGLTANVDSIRLAPTEYYKVEWLGFSGNSITSRSIPASASMIDATTVRLQSGVDQYLQHIIHSHLTANERVELSRQYRSLREEFGNKTSVRAINTRLQSEENTYTARQFSLGIDLSQRFTWESSLVAHLDSLPFHFAGKGEQSILKILLALSQRAGSADVVLIEEPEAHLTFSSLAGLIARIEEHCATKQVLIATHSAFVLNKLGLQNLILLGGGAPVRIDDLPAATVDYFKKLPGYDTLRLVLAKGAILVEGPSDELIVQRAYIDVHGHLPLDDGIDVISVGLSHKRFLDLAVRLGRRVKIVTDNDGRTLTEIRDRFSEYLSNRHVTLHVCDDPALCTLEPCIVAANSLAALNNALGTTHATSASVEEYMRKNKTSAALSIFESSERLVMPQYLSDAVA